MSGPGAAITDLNLATDQNPGTSQPGTESSGNTAESIAGAEKYAAHNYHPLPVVLSTGEGAWMQDVDGRRYLDMLAGYSALNFGHRHPKLIAAAHEQLDRLTLTSRAFYHDKFGEFCGKLAALCRKDAVLPMNTGAEAVETAVKVARKWGYDVKGVPQNAAKIVTCSGNFHGRTISIVSFSTDEEARGGFGPFTPGFSMVPYGDLAAAEVEIRDPNTVAMLVEPVQGEAGVILPPPGYLAGLRELCTQHNVLLVADEIQSGLGRTGTTFACDFEDVVPDIFILGKALGGGIVPVSAIAANWPILGVLHPGEHGSTFGGNPLACAVGIAVVDLLESGEFQEQSRVSGAHLQSRLHELPANLVSGVRCRGLWAGIDLAEGLAPARIACERLLQRGVLAKDTHGSTIRFAPALVITTDELDWAVDELHKVLKELAE
jgi:ornithine--oxo-acid transaminase